MATNDGRGVGRSEEQRLPASSSIGNSKGPGAASKRDGETVPNSGSARELPPQFGRYRIEKKLGGGGMGAVYLAHDTELDREVALKVPHFSDADDPEVRERFLREARSAAKLDHPNLCPVFDVGVLDGVYYLTMKYLKGHLLSEYAGTPQAPRKVVEIMVKLAMALESAHAKNVIHRDLKPDNVMMCGSTGPVVMDFGLAKQTKQQDQMLTQAGTMMGTPAYMPPEQVQGQLERIGPRSDIYTLGVIFFQLLTGRLPFEGTTAEVFGKILYTEAPRPSQVRPGLNPTLDAICGKATAKAPEQRYASMKLFAAALIDYLKATPATEGAGSLIPNPPSAGPGNRSGLLAAQTVAPGAGNRADLLGAATMAPGRGPASLLPKSSIGQIPAVPTQVGGKSPSSFGKPPAAAVKAHPRETEEERSGVSVGAVLGWIACLMLMLGGLGGLGFLAYTLRPKQADPAVAQGKTESKTDAEKEADKSKAVEKEGVKPKQVVSRPIDNPAPTPRPAVPTPRDDPRPTPAPVVSTPAPVVSTPVDKPRPTPMPVVPTPVVKPPETPPATVKKPDKAPPAIKETDAKVLLAEDFKKAELGGRPKGWEGDAFSVLKKEGRLCLTVVNPKPEIHYVTLPKVSIKGDFVLDCEVLLGGFYGGRQLVLGDHEFHLELSGPSGTPLPVMLNYLGGVKLGSSQLMQTEDFKPLKDIRFRLTRKKDVYNVSINGNVTAGLTIPDKGTFNEVRIGLTGGERNGRGRALLGGARGFTARLYSVKITALDGKSTAKEVVVKTPDAKTPDAKTPDKAPEVNKDDPLEKLRKGQDFKTVTAGTLPKGWTGDELKLCVQKNGGKPGLVLMDGALGGVILPPVKLPAGFWMETELAMPDYSSAVLIQFEVSPKRVLLFEVSGLGKILVQGTIVVDATRDWKRNGQINKLMLERGKESFAIKVNGNEVGSLPLKLAKGTYSQVRLGLRIIPKNARSKGPRINPGAVGTQSPRIHYVRLVPSRPEE